jgi:acyl carrier protein
MSKNVKETIAKSLDLEASQLDDSKELTSLVQDSFMLVELIMTLQEDLGVMVVQEELKDVKTVGQLVEVFSAKVS